MGVRCPISIGRPKFLGGSLNAEDVICTQRFVLPCSYASPYSNLSETVLSRWPIKAHRSRFEKPVFPERIPTELFIWMSHTIWLVPICVPRFDQVRGSARHQIFRIQHPHGFSEQSD